MKTEKITAQVIGNFNDLAASMTKPHQSDGVKDAVIWGLKYKRNNVEGFVSQTGGITRGKAEIQVANGKIRKLTKPFFTTWRRTLKKMNAMLQDINMNRNNKEIVTPRHLKIMDFKGTALDK